MPAYLAATDLMIVGEAPGVQEALEKTPFIGDSGQLLRKILSDVGFDVPKVTLTNVCKCHPPQNELPDTTAQKLCTASYLFNEIKELKPKLIVLSGSVALNTFFPGESIMGKAGNFFEKDGQKFIAALHPAYCLRNPTATPRLRKDLNKAHQYLNNELVDNNQYIVVDTQEKLDKARQELITDRPEYLSFDVETNMKLDVFDNTMALWTCGFGLSYGKAYSIPLSHPENENIQFRDKCWDLVREVMLNDSKKIAHNAAFDLKVLKKFGIESRNFYADTMVMAFLLDENRFSIGLKQLSSEYLDGCSHTFTEDMKGLCEYNGEDCSNTMGLFGKFEPQIRANKKMWKLFEKILMPEIQVIVDMELEGVLLDTTVSAKLAADIHRKLDAVYEAIADTFPESKDVNLKSTKQLRELMFGKLRYPALKQTSKGALSTDNEVLEGLARRGYKLATYLVKVRKHEKMLSTYVEKLPEIVKPDGKIHGQFNICGARTGRLSSSNPNLQNIPREKAVKKMFTAMPGCMLLQADASQMELRVACSIANEPTMIKAYQDDKDVHRLTASKALHVAEQSVTEDQRQIAKGINFGFVYGASAEGFQRLMEADYGIKFPLNECAEFRQTYFSTYSGFPVWYERTRLLLRKYGRIVYPTGRIRRFPEVKGKYFTPDDVFRKAVNSPVQGSSSDIILFMMVRMKKILDRFTLPVKMILTVHDSIVFEGPEDELIASVIYEMNNICANDIPKNFSWLKVPMKFDYSLGLNWGELKKH